MAQRKYSVSGARTNTAAKTVINVTSASTIRPSIYDIVFGSDATPADNAASYYVQRHTAAGTSTAFTPIALDPADPASLAASGFNHTVEPTLTASSYLLEWSQNQRATFRWVAAPNSELVMPATAANGLSVVTNSIGGSAVNVTCSLLYLE